MDVVAIGEIGIVRDVTSASMVPRFHVRNVLQKNMKFTCVMTSTRMSAKGMDGGVFNASY